MIRNALSWSTLVRVVNLLRNWASLDCFYAVRDLFNLVVFACVFYNASSDAVFMCKNADVGTRDVYAWLVHDKFPCDISFGL